MNEDILQKLADHILGTCTTLDAACEAIGIEEFDASDFENLLLDYGVEQCSDCGWWHESCELVPNDDEDDDLAGICDDCRAAYRKGGEQ